MRQIKFRGKPKAGYNYGKDWLYGSLLQIDDSNYGIIELSDVSYYENGYVDYSHTPIQLETVGQFTGLTDKNGKEIYEGAVVLFTWFSYGEYELETEYQGSIDFLNGSFLFCCEHGNYPLSELEFDSESDIEVIGNIHDNPELLTK